MTGIHRSIVILTGAGISAESGLATFRGAGGLWMGHRVEDVATPEAFARQPEMVHAFYNARRRQLADPAIAPNAAHEALVRLEDGWAGDFLLVTQNVDDLHERAGSKRIVHMHGELRGARCTTCDRGFAWLDDLGMDTACPHCARTGSLRPDIVWFGEMPMDLERIHRALQGCDLFISIGTSGLVYPAAGFVEAAPAARTIEINLEPTSRRSMFDEHRTGPAGTLVPALVHELLQA
ncbi:MAG: NAD-dependent deacylase [Geminicoccaceae bacterium]|nr:NAD-dependent deacylase [Geminicoccaceae bacterium]